MMWMVSQLGAFQITAQHHTYRVIVLDYFPVFYDDVEVWHYTLNFFRDGINMGTIAFEEIELQELINKGEITILSEG